jgi:hypothetical protein
LTTVVAFVGALGWVGRRPRAGAPAEVTPDSELGEVTDDVEEADVVEVADPVEMSDESATVRALRAQVRSLEQALELVPDVPAPVAVPAAADAAYRRQVLLAVRAVASRTGDDDDPRHAAARVVAAVERLDADGFARPVLPGIVSRTVATLPRPAAAPTTTPAMPTTPVLPTPAAVERTEDPVDRAEVVLPVPPPAPPEPRRSRRLRRRHATTAA